MPRAGTELRQCGPGCDSNDLDSCSCGECGRGCTGACRHSCAARSVGTLNAGNGPRCGTIRNLGRRRDGCSPCSRSRWGYGRTGACGRNCNDGHVATGSRYGAFRVPGRYNSGLGANSGARESADRGRRTRLSCLTPGG